MDSITLRGNALSGIEKLNLEARSVLMKGLVKGGYIVQGAAKENIRRNFHSTASGEPKASDGREFNSLEKSVVVIRHDKDLEVEIGPEIIYGRIRELGGIIRPVHAKFLVFEVLDPAEGRKLIFAKEVTQVGKPYLRPALEKNQTAILQRLGLDIQAWIETTEKTSKVGEIK